MAYAARRLGILIAVYARGDNCAKAKRPYKIKPMLDGVLYVYEPSYWELPEDYVIPFVATEFVTGESF